MTRKDSSLVLLYSASLIALHVIHPYVVEMYYAWPMAVILVADSPRRKMRDRILQWVSAMTLIACLSLHDHSMHALYGWIAGSGAATVVLNEAMAHVMKRREIRLAELIDLTDAHKMCSHHRAALLASTHVGCFHCEQIIVPTDITEWGDQGETGICPRCGIDALIGDKQHDISPKFLAAMGKQFFV